MKKLSKTVVTVVAFYLSISIVHAQIKGGGTGGWDENQQTRSTIELNYLTKKLFRNYSQNITKCDEEVKTVKIKTWQDFSLSIIKQAIRNPELKEMNQLGKDTQCPNKSSDNDNTSIKKNNLSNCGLKDEEILIIQKLVQTKNFNEYLINKHKLSEEDAMELIELLKHLIENPDESEQRVK